MKRFAVLFVIFLCAACGATPSADTNSGDNQDGASIEATMVDDDGDPIADLTGTWAMVETNCTGMIEEFEIDQNNGDATVTVTGPANSGVGENEEIVADVYLYTSMLGNGDQTAIGVAGLGCTGFLEESVDEETPEGLSVGVGDIYLQCGSAGGGICAGVYR